MLFVGIFTVLAAGIGIYVFFSRGSQSANTGEFTISTASTTEVVTPAPESPLQSFFSSFSSLFSFSFNTPSSRVSNYFSITTGSRGGSSGQSSETGGQVPVYRIGMEPPTTVLTATEQRIQYQKQLEGIYGEVQSAQQQVNEIALILQSSPLRGLLWISRVYRSSDPAREYIALSSTSALPKETVLTGLTIKSVSSGQTVQIPQGVLIPQTNQTNVLEDIRMYPKQTVYIVSGKSPLGYSFLTNTCTGYLSQFQSFIPGLPQSCPRLQNVQTPPPPNQLSDSCLDYIKNFPACRIIANPAAPLTDQQYDCLTFIQDHTGYQNCLTQHQRDSSFWSTAQWRIYLNHTERLWKTEREVIWLLDKDGKFISQYSY